MLDTDDTALEEAILALAALPYLDYQRVRLAKAKELGLRAGVLDAAIRAARHASGQEQERVAQRDALVTIGLEAKLWQDDTAAGFASVEVDGHVEHHPIRSRAFTRWLVRTYGDRNPVPTAEGGTRPAVPGAQAQEATDALDAYATRGPAEPWFVRLGWTASAVYLDLGIPTWAAVEITAAGWRVVPRPPGRGRPIRRRPPRPSGPRRSSRSTSWASCSWT